MIKLILKFIGGPLLGSLLDAWKLKLEADNDEKRIVADAAIADIKAQIEAKQIAASVVKEGMQHKVFWIPWLIAAVPCSMWLGWGMFDSMLYDGTLLPDVAKLPPQIEKYADMVFNNIFYAGGGAAGVQAIASAIRGRK